MDPDPDRPATGAVSDPRALRSARNLRACHLALEIGLMIIVVGSVLAFGSVHPRAYRSLWGVSLAVGAVLPAFLFAGRFLRRLVGGRRVSFHPSGRWLVLDASVFYTRPGWSVDLSRPLIARGPLLMPGLIFLTWVSLQLVLLPAPVVRALRPGRAVETAGWLPISVNPQDTARGLAFLVTALLIHVVASTVFRSPSSRRRFERLIVGLGLFVSLVGFVQLATGARRVYGFFKPWESDGELIFGPFVNRNNFAGYMLLVVFVSLGFFARAYRGYSERVGTRPTARRRLVGLAAPEGTRLVFAFAPVVVCSAALLATGSRAASIAFAVGLVLAVAASQRKVGRGAVAILVLGLLWLPLDLLQRRFNRLSTQSVGRTAVWSDAMSRMGGLWLTGSGFNTYGTAMSRTTAWALPRGATPWRAPIETSVATASNMGYRVAQETRNVFWYREAHNDYLQLLVETGVPGLVLGSLAIIVIVRSARRNTWLLAGVVAVLLHELVDFPLQIPAVSVLFMVVTALAATKTPSDSRFIPSERLSPVDDERAFTNGETADLL